MTYEESQQVLAVLERLGRLAGTRVRFVGKPGRTSGGRDEQQKAPGFGDINVRRLLTGMTGVIEEIDPEDDLLPLCVRWRGLRAGHWGLPIQYQPRPTRLVCYYWVGFDDLEIVPARARRLQARSRRPS